MVTKVQLGLLGFDVDNAASNIVTDVTDNNLSAIQQVLINLNLDTDFTNLTSLTQLQTLTNNAISALNALEAAAQGDDASAISATTAFSDMGVTTVTSGGETAGTANNLEAIKTVLASTAITGSDADTYEDVKALVDSYNVLLAYAEGGSTEPELSDYQTLGLSGISTADQLALMNSLIATTNDAGLIDTAAKLQAKATAVAHILSTTEVTDVEGIDAALVEDAKTGGSDVASIGDYLTTADLEALGFSYVDTGTTSATLVDGGNATAEITPENLDAIRLAIANTADDHSDVLDFTTLKTLVEDTAKAANTIQKYGAADSSSATPVPTADDYIAIGVTGVTDANVSAINSSLATNGVLDTISTSVAVETQDLVDTWAKVEILADGEIQSYTLVTSGPSSVFALGDGNNSGGGGTTLTNTNSAFDPDLTSTLSTNFAGEEVSTSFGTYAFGNLLDGNNGTYEVDGSRISEVTPLNIEIAFSHAQRVTDYSLSFVDNDFATDWKLWAKASDGSYSILLDEVSSHSVSASTSFSIEQNVEDYTYLKLEILSANDQLAFSELQFTSSNQSESVDNSYVMAASDFVALEPSD
jgi:hypothetical protein